MVSTRNYPLPATESLCPLTSFTFLDLYYSWLTPQQTGSNGAPLGERSTESEACADFWLPLQSAELGGRRAPHPLPPLSSVKCDQ